MLIQYHVWFSFKPEADVSAELIKVRACLDGYLQRGMLAGYRMFKKRPGLSNDLLPPFHVAIEFTNGAQFAAPFSDRGPSTPQSHSIGRTRYTARVFILAPHTN